MSPLVPLLMLVTVMACDVWVYWDATSRERRGDPVVVTFFGSFTLDSAVKWTVACVVLFVLCFPLYLVARGSARPGDV